MARTRADYKPRNVAMQHGQQAIWTEIRRLNIFSITDIEGVVEMHRTSIKSYIKCLEAGRYIEKHRSYEETFRYKLIRDTGHHAPRLKRDGTPVTQGQGNMNMWRSMRMLPQFSPQDLATHSTTCDVVVEEATAKKYCHMLLRANYLVVIKKATNKSQALYRLKRNTGPLPPQIQRVQQVYDQNLGEVTYYPGGENV